MVVVSFTLRLLYPQGKSIPAGTHWIGGWVIPRAGLNEVAKRKYSFSVPTENRTSVAQPVA
jgi:hypothetical protein